MGYILLIKRVWNDGPLAPTYVMRWAGGYAQ